MYCNLNAGQTERERSTWHNKANMTFPKTVLVTFGGIRPLLNEFCYNLFVQYAQSASIKRANCNQMSKKRKEEEKILGRQPAPTKSTHITHPPQCRLALVYCGRTRVGGCAGEPRSKTP